MLPKGIYKTKNGSTVEICGKYGKAYRIYFDWLEEEYACLDCKPYYADNKLMWCCEECGGGWAELEKG